MRVARRGGGCWKGVQGGKGRGFGRLRRLGGRGGRLGAAAAAYEIEVEMCGVERGRPGKGMCLETLGLGAATRRTIGYLRHAGRNSPTGLPD